MEKIFAAFLTIGTVALATSAAAGPVSPRPKKPHVQPAAAVPKGAAPTTISQWTFETNPPADVTSSFGPSVAADAGNGTATEAHTTAGSNWTTPTGNGSAHSLGVDNWNVNDYFKFSLSTVGQTSIFVTFSQTSSSTGPADFKLQYSTNNGINFNLASTYSVSANSGNWSTSSGNFAAGDEFTFNLSSVTALNNNAHVVFLLSDNGTTAAGGGTVAAGGTSRIDDFFVSAGAAEYPAGFVVPEPGTWMLMGFGLLLGVQRLRRKI
jgi:hypothetical protein